VIVAAVILEPDDFSNMHQGRVAERILT
jgi:hypothetical protein